MLCLSFSPPSSSAHSFCFFASTAEREGLFLLLPMALHFLSQHCHQQPLAATGPHNDNHRSHPGDGRVQHGEAAYTVVNVVPRSEDLRHCQGPSGQKAAAAKHIIEQRIIFKQNKNDGVRVSLEWSAVTELQLNPFTPCFHALHKYNYCVGLKTVSMFYSVSNKALRWSQNILGNLITELYFVHVELNLTNYSSLSSYKQTPLFIFYKLIGLIIR